MCEAVITRGKRNPYSPRAHRLSRFRSELRIKYLHVRHRRDETKRLICMHWLRPCSSSRSAESVCDKLSCVTVCCRHAAGSGLGTCVQQAQLRHSLLQTCSRQSAGQAGKAVLLTGTQWMKQGFWVHDDDEARKDELDGSHRHSGSATQGPASGAGNTSAVAPQSLQGRGRQRKRGQRPALHSTELLSKGP